VRAHHLIISSALTQAYKWGLIQRSVAPLATLPMVEQRDPTLPTLDQIALLVRLTKDSDPVLSAAIMLAALTGCRRGELCGLRWGDVDEARMVLNVRRAAKRAQGGEKIIGPTKTHKTRRLSIDDVTVAVINEHRARAVEWAAAAEVEVDDDGFVLTWDPSGAAPANPDVITTKRAVISTREPLKAAPLPSRRCEACLAYGLSQPRPRAAASSGDLRVAKLTSSTAALRGGRLALVTEPRRVGAPMGSADRRAGQCGPQGGAARGAARPFRRPQKHRHLRPGRQEARTAGR
jgi:hypothetical protein